MGPFLNNSLLPKKLDVLNHEMKIIEDLIREQEDKLKEAREQKTKTLKKFYVLESTRDKKESEVNKLISKIELELHMLKQAYQILENNRWRYGDATKQVESVGTGTSPVEMTPLPKQKSMLRSFLKSVRKSLTNRRSSASKPHTGGRKTRRQRTRRAH
jgi:hypothetical protein